MAKKIIFTIVVFLICFSLGAAIKANAGFSDNVYGWIWGGSEDVNIGPTGTLNDGNETGLGWISMNNVDESGNIIDGVNSYGVNIPDADGDLSGYAWSSNLGWIDFNNIDCPIGIPGNCTARREGNNLAGYARVVSIENDLAIGNSGGWEGFISLSGVADDGSLYGVDIAKMDGIGSNPTYAWSNELGWIDFSRAKATASKTLKICRNSCDGGTPLFSMEKGDRSYIVACFNSNFGCGENSGDVTGAAVWSEQVGNDAISLTDINPKTVNADNIGSEKITADYSVDGNNYSAEYTVNVLCVPNPSCAASNICARKTCNNGCGITITGTKNCSWQEVAP